MSLIMTFCSYQGFWHDEVHKVCYGRYNQLAINSPSLLRTLSNTIANGNKAMDMLDRTGTIDCSKTAGVKGQSPFHHLPYFDVTRDCTLDMMHITSGVVGRHLAKLLTGMKLKASASKAKKDAREEAKKTQEQIDADLRAAALAAERAERKEAEQEMKLRDRADKAIAAKQVIADSVRKSHAARARAQEQANELATKEANRRRQVKRAKEERERARRAVVDSRDPPSARSLDQFVQLWSIPEATRLLIEERCYRQLSAPRGVAPVSKRPLTLTSEMQAHHWVNFAKVYGVYLIHHCMRGEEQREAVYAATQLLQVIKLSLTSTVTPSLIDRLHQVITTVARNFNDRFPPHMKVMMIHLLMAHIPATLAYWGPARGYWNFPYERSVPTMCHNVPHCAPMCPNVPQCATTRRNV